MRKRHTRLLPINGLLNTLFGDLGITERIKLDTLRRQWREIFSEPLSLHTAPTDLKDGILVIAVDSPTWLQHLKFLQKEILEKLKAHDIKDVKLKHGSVRFESSRKIHEKKAPPEAFRELTDQDNARIDRTVAEIGDDELKDAIRHAMEKSTRRKMTER